jgi:hypothetical protein
MYYVNLQNYFSYLLMYAKKGKEKKREIYEKKKEIK